MSTKTQIAYANQPVTLYTQADTGFAYDGYDFLGWSKSSTATAATYSGGQTTTFGSNTSLYAVWKEKSVTPDPEPTKIDISDKVILSGDASDLGLSLYYQSIDNMILRYSYIDMGNYG